MCGFAGITGGSFINQDMVRSMGETILHRGPDHTGYFFDQHSGFVHNRLSLLDISSNGNQPFVDDRHVLLFNGEIYNHNQLRERHLGDISFISTSDTETLFHLLSRFGVRQTSALIHGMFAFAWYDRQRAEISLVRDRIGIKPLFYMVRSGQLVFASEQKAITGHFDLQEDRLLVMSSTLGEIEYNRTHTAFTDLHQLEPGAILQFGTDGSVSTEKYFKITDLVDKDYYGELDAMPYDAVQREFDRLLCKSVDSMMMSDVGMGSFISGGLDSSLITAIAARSQPITLYTANVVGRYSELDACRTVASHIAQTLHVYDYEPGYFIRDLVRTTWHYESPITVHGSALPFNGVAGLARRTGTKAVITGEGSDELFLGYPRLLTRKFDRLLRFPYALFDGLYAKIPGLTKYLNLKKHNYSNDLLYMPFIGDRKGDAIEYAGAYEFLSDGKKASDQALTLEMLGRGLHSLLWRNDRVGMMHSIESRFPFLDEDLLRFAANLPVRMKIGATGSLHNIKHPFRMDKKVVRTLAEKYIPRKVARMEKKGFIIFGHASLRISKGFFRDGYVQELLRLNTMDASLMETTLDAYLLSKLAQVEIWGRLFARKEGIDTVSDKVEREMSMVP
jgi:asparagine synthase (glutamine-hydrolysing)